MNSLERLIASANGEPIDCVPVAPSIGHYAAVKAGEPMTKVAYDPELMARVVIQSLERHGYDACCPITDYGVGTESMGSTPVIRDWEQTYVGEFAVKSKADISSLKVPDPLKDDRMPVAIECGQILMEKVGEYVGVSCGISGPLSFAASLRGSQQIVEDVLEDPKFVHDLLKISREAVKSFGEALVITGGITTINIYEPMATLLSTPQAEEFSFVYMESLIKELKESGAYTILLHICGDTTRFLNRMVDIGANIISLDSNVDLAEAKEIVDGRATISGNVATQNLFFRSEEIIYAESCRCIESAAWGGRYALGSSCEVPLETPEENIDAMVRAAHEFGAKFLQNRMEVEQGG